MSRFFTLAPRIYFKYGCSPLCFRELIQQDERKRFLIVCSKSVANSGIVSHIASVITLNNAKYFVYNVLDTVCTDETVDAVIESAKAFNADAIVSVGGGSIMSVGKLAWLKLEQPQKRRDPAIFNVVVPTTTGSGAEVTPFAVISRDGKAVTVFNDAMVPHMSICDPQYSMKLGTQLTAVSGVHAAANAVEALLSTYCSDYIAPFAMGSLRLVAENLGFAISHPDAVSAREHLTNASFMAGIAHANLEHAGVLHTLLLDLHNQFGVNFGAAAAVVLPKLVAMTKLTEKRRIQYIEDTFGSMEKLAETVSKVVAESGLPTTRAVFGAEFEKGVEAIVAGWKNDEFTAEQVKQLLLSC